MKTRTKKAISKAVSLFTAVAFTLSSVSFVILPMLDLNTAIAADDTPAAAADGAICVHGDDEGTKTIKITFTPVENEALADDSSKEDSSEPDVTTTVDGDDDSSDTESGAETTTVENTAPEESATKAPEEGISATAEVSATVISGEWADYVTLSIDGNAVANNDEINVGDTIAVTINDEALFASVDIAAITVPDVGKTETITLTYHNYYDKIAGALGNTAKITTAKEGSNIVHLGDTVVIAPEYGYTVNGNQGPFTLTYENEDSIEFEIEKTEVGIANFAARFAAVEPDVAKKGDIVTIKVKNGYSISADAFTVEYTENDEKKSINPTGADGVYTFKYPESAEEGGVDVKVNSSKVNCLLELDSAAEGIAEFTFENGSTSGYYQLGSEIRFKAVTVNGYKILTADAFSAKTFEGVDSSGVSFEAVSDAENTFKLVVPDTPVKISATAEKVKLAGINGNVAGGEVKVSCGGTDLAVGANIDDPENIEIVVTPKDGYIVDTVSVKTGDDSKKLDGTIDETTGIATYSYTSDALHDDIYVEVTYKILVSITVTDGDTSADPAGPDENGDVSAEINGNKVQFTFADMTVNAAAANGYHIESFKDSIGGAAASEPAALKKYTSEDQEYTVGNDDPRSWTKSEYQIDEDLTLTHVINVVFAVNSYTVEKGTVSAGGSVEIDPGSVIYDKNSTITITPGSADKYMQSFTVAKKAVGVAAYTADTSFDFESLKYNDDGSVTLQIEGITDDYQIDVTFADVNATEYEPTVTASAADHISKVDETTINEYYVQNGETVTINFDTLTADGEILKCYLLNDQDDSTKEISYADSRVFNITNVTANTTVTVYTREKDADGSIYVAKTTINLYVDTKGPELSVAMSGDLYPNVAAPEDSKSFYTTSLAVTAKDQGSSISGVKKITYSVGGATGTLEPGDFIDPDTGKVEAIEGGYKITIYSDFSGTITFVAYDNVDLTSAPTYVTVVNDITAPTIKENEATVATKRGEDEAWYVNTTIVADLADENGAARSGIADAEYRIDGGEWVSAKNNRNIMFDGAVIGNISFDEGSKQVKAVFSDNYEGEFDLRAVDNVSISSTDTDDVVNENPADNILEYDIYNCVDKPFMVIDTDIYNKGVNTTWVNDTEFTVQGQNTSAPGVSQIQFSFDNNSWTDLAELDDGKIFYDGEVVAIATEVTSVMPEPEVAITGEYVDRAGDVVDPIKCYKIVFVGDYNGGMHFRCSNLVENNSKEYVYSDSLGLAIMNDVTAPAIAAEATVYTEGDKTGTKVDIAKGATGVKTVIDLTVNDPAKNITGRDIVPSGIKTIQLSYDGYTTINGQTVEASSNGLVAFDPAKKVSIGEYGTISVISADAGKWQVILDRAANNLDFEGTITFVATDNAGNIIEEEVKVSVHNITTPPVVEIVNFTEKWRKQTYINVTADTVSKLGDVTVDKIQYSFTANDDDWVDVTTDLADVTYNKVIGSVSRSDNSISMTIDKDYHGYIYFRAVNNLGVVTDKADYQSCLVKNDVTDPKFEASATVTRVSGSGEPRHLAFGIFDNNNVKIRLKATDLMPDGTVNTGKNDNKASLINRIEVYSGKTKIGEMTSEGNDYYTYEFAFGINYTSIHFVATDNSAPDGNATDKTLVELLKNSTVTENRIHTENTPAIIIIDPVLGNKVTVDGKVWVSEDFSYKVAVNDSQTGIYHIDVTVDNTNGAAASNRTVDEDIDGNRAAQQNDWTRTYKITRQGANTITVDAVDNAYNTSEKSATVYLDKTAPKVTGFKFAAADFKESNTEDSPRVQISDEYGFYFDKATNVTVSVKDDSNSSSIRSITFYKIPKDKNARVDEQTVDVSNSNSGSWKDGYTASATFTVEAGFKGQIFAVVTDMVGNTSETGNNRTNAHPDGTVVETQSQHDSSALIALDRATTTMTDISGTDLYAADQDVVISVSDQISGIKTIEWTVENPIDGVTQSGTLQIDNSRGLSGDSGWTEVSHDVNLVTAITKTIRVSENRNNITIRVKLTDRAGNTSENETVLSIDKTAPTIDITYNNIPSTTHDGVTYYNKDRVATIIITERNFSLSDLPVITIGGGIAAITDWEQISNNASNPDSNQWRCTVTFSADADYTFAVSYADLAGNEVSRTENDFTVDQTDPTISLVFDNNSAENSNYYDDVRTATITITEHNFNSADVVVDMTSYGEDNVTSTEDPEVSQWTSNGDVHTATVKYLDSGKYNINVYYTDLANNKASDATSGEFYIDLIDPEFEIDGVENNTAYDDEIIPVITFSDYNLYESADDEYIAHTEVSFTRISLKGYGDSSLISRTNQQYYAANDENSYMNSYVLSYDSFAQEEALDGIYALHVTVYDKSGRSSSEDIVFSVNRFGSTYRIVNEEAVELIENYNNGIYSNQEVNIEVEEINVTPLDESKSSITVVINESSNTELVKGTDYTMSSVRGRADSVLDSLDSYSNSNVDKEDRADGWYAYYYNINAENFANDARYQINITSNDGDGLAGADHESGNSTPLYDDRKCPINFIIDKTAPEIVIAGASNDQNIEEASVDLTITCSDLHLSSVDKLNSDYLEVTVNGDTYDIDTLKISTNDSDDIIITLPVEAKESNAEKIVSVRIKDLAGNWSDKDDDDIGKVTFTLSATWLKRLIDNTPLFIGLLALLILLVAGIIVFIVFLVKRRR